MIKLSLNKKCIFLYIEIKHNKGQFPAHPNINL